MALGDEAVDVDFDVDQLEGAADPYGLFAELRAAGPLVRTPSGFLVATTWPAAMDVLRSPDATSGMIGQRYRDVLPPGAARDELSHRINFLDPPDHPRVRSLVSKAFTPRRVTALRPFVEQTTERILDELVEQGSFDLLHDLAHQVPSLVISELLGVPVEDRDRLTALSDLVTPLLGISVDPADKVTAIEAAEEMHDALGALLVERQADPGDDLLSALLLAEEDGERLSRPELLSLAATLYSAGHRTTRDSTVNGMSVLLRGEGVPGPTVASTVQEMLRFETPTLYVARLLPAGPVLILLGSANRDEGTYADAGRYRADRWSAEPAPPGPLSFAFGAHYCLGASLARMEAEVMVDALLARPLVLDLPESEELHWRLRGPFRSLESLPVRVDADAAA